MSEGVLDRKLFVESSDGDFARQTCLALGKTSYALPQKKMSEAAREIEKFWPALPEYGYAGISTGYTKIRHDEEEDFPLQFGDHRFAFAMDLRTFVDVFGDPRGLVDHLSVAADTVVNRWNDKNSGNKNAGNRMLDQECFGLRDVVQVNQKGDIKYSTMIIAATNRFANKKLQNSSDAWMTPDDMHVQLKLLKGVGNNMQRPSICGVYIPIDDFFAMAQSEDMEAAVQQARQFLDQLEPSDIDTLRWRFVRGDDNEAEGKELKDHLLNIRKKAKEAAPPPSKRKRTD